MSKQDIKDEYKKSEGDPLIKGKIREKQRRMAMQRMMQDVPKADVIITNPTHFAVALQYDGSKMQLRPSLPKGPTSSLSRSDKSPKTMASLRSKINRSPGLCTLRWKSEKRFPPTCSKPWPKY